MEWGGSGNHLRMHTSLEAEVPLKVSIFWRLLIRRRPMTHVFLKKMFPDASIECLMCRRGEEDCSHLFFECLLAHRIGTMQNISGGYTTSDKTFSERSLWSI